MGGVNTKHEEDHGGGGDTAKNRKSTPNADKTKEETASRKATVTISSSDSNDPSDELKVDDDFDPENYDPKTAGPILPNGEINWECPCLGGAAHGPCGTEFRDAFSCFHYSKEEVKGSDCFAQFREMQTCFSKYPELYGPKEGEEDEEEDEDEVEFDEEELELIDREGGKKDHKEKEQSPPNPSPEPAKPKAEVRKLPSADKPSISPKESYLPGAPKPNVM